MTKLQRGITLLLTLIFCCSLGAVYAAPAIQRPITVTEPDGSTFTIYLNGDEYFSWRTTVDGTPIVQKEGYYYHALYQETGEVEATSQRAVSNGILAKPKAAIVAQDMTTIARNAMMTKRAEGQTTTVKAAAFPTDGTIKSIVILVEFQDVKFTTENANEAFHNLLNQEGYSDNGATGSARDYFAANSGGTYIGDFDVYGPYTLDNNCAYYGGNNSYGNDSRPQQMTIDAVAMCDADGVDFSQYDYDNDGYIDNVFVYYAGYNEAEGGDEDTVWPHRYYVYDNTAYDGKILYGYACSSELRSNSGTTIAGIGTFCHEFSHVLGLADHYDTNGSTNGTSDGLGAYDIMSSGNYNNNGRTPPMYNALELEMVEWCIPTIPDSEGEEYLSPLNYFDKKTLRIDTEVEGEYFLIENRSLSHIVWDSYIPAEGLIIYHVDRSSPYMSYWNSNAPNGDSSHECLKFVQANSSTLVSISTVWALVPYPGITNNEWSSTSSPRAESWGEVAAPYQLKNITRAENEEGDIYFDIIAREQATISGLITDYNTGIGIADATVTLESVADGITYSCYTGSSGWYELDQLPDGDYRIIATASDYSSKTETIELTQGTTQNIELVNSINYLGYHNSTPTYGFTFTSWHKAYITLDSSKLASLTGNAITGINVYMTTSFQGATVGITPSNGDMVSKEVSKTISGSGWQLVDVSEFGLVVEEGVTYDVSIEGNTSWVFVIDNDTDGNYDGLSNMMVLDAEENSAFTISELTGGSCLGNIMLELVVSNPVVVEASDAVGDIVFNITNSSNETIANASITLSPLDMAADSTYCTIANSAGYALLPRLPYGSYTLTVSAEGYDDSQTEVTVASAASSCDITLYTVDGLASETIACTAPRVTVVANTLYIEADCSLEQVDITTLQGSRIRTLVNPTNAVDLASLPSGIYIVSITTQAGKYIHKIVK